MAKPKLALLPAAQGTSLYSVLPSSGVGDFNFTRSGSATRINSQGLIETVTSGVSRLNYPMIDGVVKGCPHHILEPQRTNLIQYSEDFIQSYWTKTNSSVTSNSVISPDGTLNADKITPTTTSGVHKVGRNLSSVSGDYTLSVFAKKGELKNILLWDDNLSEGIGVNLDDLSVFRNVGNEGYNIENYGNGWVRISVTFNYAAQDLRYAVYVYNNSFEITYQGNNIDSLYIYGAQLEQGSYATSYIPNYGTSGGVTRSAETATGSGDASTFNDSEGVLMAEVSKDKGTQYSLISLQKSSVSDTYAYIGYLNNNTTIRGQIKVGGTTVLDEEIEMSDTSIVAKILIKYKSGDYSMWVNGFEVGSNTNSTIFSDGDLNEIEFGYNNNSSFRFYGKTKQLQYFDTTDIDLEQLTSWVSFTDMAESQLYSIE